MKLQLLSIILLFSAVVPTESVGANTYREIHEYLSEYRTVYTITEDIDLEGKILDLPAGKTVKFSGGTIRNGEVKINNAFIISPSYQIFGNRLTISEKFGNREIRPEWFDGDVEIGLQKAIACAGESKVIVDDITITKPIRISKDGSKFTCLGKIEVTGNCDTAIILSGNNINIDISEINVSTDVSAKRDRTAVYITDTLTNSSIKIDRIGFPKHKYGFKTAFEIEKKEDVIPYIENNIFLFSFLYIDTIKSGGSCFNIKDAYFCNNLIKGGRLTGSSGINISGGEVKENIFTNIGFEDIYSCCMNLKGTENNRFEYLRMSESIPAVGSIKMTKCKDNSIQIKSTLSEKSFQLSQNGINEITASYNLYFGGEWDFGCHGINTAFTSGSSLFFSSVPGSSGSMKELTFESVDYDGDPDTLRYKDLCIDLGDELSGLRQTTKAVRITVGKNRHVILDLNKGMSSIPTNQSTFIFLDLKDETSEFKLNTVNNSQPSDSILICNGKLSSGNYQLVWSFRESESSSGKTNVTKIKKWYPALIKIKQ